MPETEPQPEKQPSPCSLKKAFTYVRGKWWPAWAALAAPFLLLLLYLYRIARREVCWKAAWATVIVFELTVFPAEYCSLIRGHWIYNEARILGPKILGVPIEEPLIYYLFPPIFVIVLMHLIHMALNRKKGST